MKKILIICSLLLSNQLFAQHNSDKTIPWNQTRKLNWDDFKYVNKKALPKNTKAVISPKFDFSISEGDTLFLKVRIILEKGKSVTTDTISKNILAHEQLHFDIAEYFARKMRKRFSVLSAKGCNDMTFFQESIDQIHQEYLIFQSQYDKGTKHSIDREQQVLWNKKVSTLLKALDKYQYKTK